jgi:hypothetical protein
MQPNIELLPTQSESKKLDITSHIVLGTLPKFDRIEVKLRKVTTRSFWGRILLRFEEGDVKFFVANAGRRRSAVYAESDKTGRSYLSFYDSFAELKSDASIPAQYLPNIKAALRTSAIELVDKELDKELDPDSDEKEEDEC